jgi:hypothetical protein
LSRLPEAPLADEVPREERRERATPATQPVQMTVRKPKRAGEVLDGRQSEARVDEVQQVLVAGENSPS